MCVALAAVLTMSLTSVAQEVEDDLSDENVVLSVDDFADLAEDYGFIVVRESDNFPVTYMAKEYTITLTNNKINEVGKDNPLLNEKVRVKVVSLSDNIDSVTVCISNRKTASWTDKTYDLMAGDWSNTFEAKFLVGYKVGVQANSSSPLSSSNPGEVTVYWSDKEDW